MPHLMEEYQRIADNNNHNCNNNSYNRADKRAGATMNLDSVMRNMAIYCAVTLLIINTIGASCIRQAIRINMVGEKKTEGENREKSPTTNKCSELVFDVLHD